MPGLGPTPPPLLPALPAGAIGVFRSIRRQSTKRCVLGEKIDFAKQCFFAKEEVFLNRCLFRVMIEK